MGDGNFKKVKKVFRLCTNSNSKEEVEKISNVLLNKFGIESRLEHVRNQQYIIVIRTSQLPLLQQLVKDHIHPSFYYRIGILNDITTI